MRAPMLLLTAALALAGCTTDRSGCAGDTCGTVVFAGIGQATTLLPPVADAAIDRDIHDQIFLKLADIGENGNTVGDAEFEPRLADRWSWTDSQTLAFTLHHDLRWHDGRRVTAEDVAFTFAAYNDTALNSPFRESLGAIASVTAQDSTTAVFRFNRRYPEMFFDAVYHMRILPAHLLRAVPYAQWRSAEFGRAPVGNGPYRFVSWTAGQSLELAADTLNTRFRGHIQRLIWRFNADLPTAVTQVVAGEADAIEVLVSPPNIQRARDAAHLTLQPYAGSVYTIARYNLRARGAARPHPVFGDAVVRRALVLATDRERMLRAVFGEYGKVPPAPIPQMWKGLWFTDLPVPPYDTAQAIQLLEQQGWRRGADGVRARGGQRLAFAIAVPGTSAARKMYAQMIQEQLRAVGAAVEIEEMDPPTLGQRLQRGLFDMAIESRASDPTPSANVPDQWGRTGTVNFGHYENPAFEREVAAARAAASRDGAQRAWRAAFGIFAQDAPAIVLNAPDNVAAIHKRIAGVKLRPDSYWAWVNAWRIPNDQLIDRDRVSR